MFITHHKTPLFTTVQYINDILGFNSEVAHKLNLGWTILSTHHNVTPTELGFDHIYVCFMCNYDRHKTDIVLDVLYDRLFKGLKHYFNMVKLSESPGFLQYKLIFDSSLQGHIICDIFITRKNGLSTLDVKVFYGISDEFTIIHLFDVILELPYPSDTLIKTKLSSITKESVTLKNIYLGSENYGVLF